MDDPLVKVNFSTSLSSSSESPTSENSSRSVRRLFPTDSKIGYLTCQSRFCLTEMKNASTCVILSSFPKMKLEIFRAIYSKNKTTLLMPLPNFALMIKQKFLSAFEKPNSYNAHAASMAHHLRPFSLFAFQLDNIGV